jgi:hypothetical protein
MALISNTSQSTGGQESIIGWGSEEWKVHIFTSHTVNSTFIANVALTGVEILIAAGGGGGGRAGGGGGGGLLVLQAGTGNYGTYPLAMSAGTYAIEVGIAGVGHTADNHSNKTTAGDSSVNNGSGVMSNSGTIGVTAFLTKGGGYGGYSQNAGSSGGSGGGGGFNSTTSSPSATQSSQNSGTNYTGFQFGSAGGAGAGASGSNSGGGGGGAGNVGEAGSSGHVPGGGIGKQFNFRGYTEWFCTGGMGDGHSGAPEILSNQCDSRIGKGGWHQGVRDKPSQAHYTIGKPQCYGGGSAGAHSDTTSGSPADPDMAGKQGIVIIRYKI